MSKNMRDFVFRHVVGVVRNPDIQFVRDLAYLTGGHFISKIIGLVLFAYLARTLPPEDYGMVEYLLAVLGFSINFIDFGFGQVGVRERTLSISSDNIVNEIPTLRTLSALVIAPIVGIFIFWTVDDPSARLLGYIFAATLLLHAWKQEWVLQSMEKLNLVALGQLIRVVLMAGITVVLVSEPDDLIWVGAAEFVSVAAWVFFLLRFQMAAGFEPVFSLSWRRLTFLLQRAAPLGLNSVIWGIVQFIPPIMVALLAGLEQAAFYALAQRFVLALQSISYTYHFNMYASLIRRLGQGMEHLRKLSLASLRVVAWATVGPAIVCSAFGQEMFTFAFGEEYREAGLVLSVFVFVIPIQILSGQNRWALMAMGQNKSVLASGVGGAFIAVVLGYVLISNQGALGGAISSVLAALAIWTVAGILCLRHGLSIPILSRVLLPAGLAISCLFFANWVNESSWVFQFFISAGLYVLMAPIVDRSLLKDIRHLAYSKRTATKKGG